MGDEDKNIDKTEWDQINKDIESAKGSIVSKEVEAKIQAAKEEARKEAEKEMLVNQKIKELEETNQKLQEAKEAKEKEAAEQIEKIKAKVDELSSSKASVQQDNPFTNGKDQSSRGVDNWSDTDLNKYEEEHAKAFFGEEQYNRMLANR